MHVSQTPNPANLASATDAVFFTLVSGLDGLVAFSAKGILFYVS